MPSNNNDDRENPPPLSPVQLDLQLTDKEVDDALNFDFDIMAETMGDALPNINLDDMGSLGTRSPSPSESASVFSKGSKRSRAEFDSESECDSNRDARSKRMVFQTGYAMSRSDSGLDIDQQQYQLDKVAQQNVGQKSSPTKVIKQDREREGRCPDCGLDTHRLVMNENGFDMQPLTIEGEVLNGRCLLCHPLKDGEIMLDMPSAGVIPKKGGRKNGESSASKKKGGGSRNNESELIDLFQESKQSPRPPPSRGSKNMGTNMNNMGSPSPHQQQRQMMRNMVQLSPKSGNLPFPPPGRDSRRSGKFTPTPNQYHSQMALMKQAQLQRKHSVKQHCMLAFGNTNNRAGKKGRNQSSGLGRRFSGGNQVGNKSGPPGGNGSGMWAQQADRQVHSSNASISSVSCSEVEGAHLLSNGNHNLLDGDDTYSRASQYSQNSIGGGGLGRAMAMGMGMNCTETSTGDHNNLPQQQQPMSRSQSPHPQTPHSQRRSPPGPPLSRSGSTAQTPQSVPINMKNTMSGRVSQTPQSVPTNLNNTMSVRMGGGNQGQSSQSPPIIGNVPHAVRVAHGKLQSSIYHHHVFPMNGETERAHAEKTLGYLESGSGDICDIIVAMRRFPFSLAIQRVASEKLFAHCFDQEHANAIGLVGGIRTIIDAMEHHPDDVSLQQECLGVIKNLATASKYNLEMLDRMGAVAIVVTTMERHERNAALLESCCWAMESMTRNPSSELKMRVAKSGGIHAAMKAVEIFPNNESLLRAAFHCLRQLGYNPSTYNSSQQHPQQQQQQQQQQRHGSNSQHQQQQKNQQRQQQQHQQQQQQQQQQVPSFVSHRGGGGGGMTRGSGMVVPNMSNSSMMGNNPMMGSNNNMMGNNAMMGNNNNNNSNRRM
mmetsp:Transcript_9696/g.21866  ORF Transcript_9696/g.21866 Transcript_9696/m.21866 type:complete len:880 (+) Transcript_9696:432-3071(+)|eukprot:CAMPEP_0172314782 /NCGR_PEP_ID=MMETSP1058-20130122/23333_1 /TAXON_ID=83371 /ORGANISM="Detonula confervacea, Strain CCMP 353" /LENGTH=879 /DNA_ID=CAMNT_0013028729 /DNA_START=411 /DNA_END=3050 /DNA_ORIENTATION=+